MKKIIVLFSALILSLSGCKHKMVEPVAFDDIITPYMTDSILDVERFNKDNSKTGKIVSICNRKKDLEFIFILSNNEEVIYYKNGTQHRFITEKQTLSHPLRRNSPHTNAVATPTLSDSEVGCPAG